MNKTSNLHSDTSQNKFDLKRNTMQCEHLVSENIDPN